MLKKTLEKIQSVKKEHGSYRIYALKHIADVFMNMKDKRIDSKKFGIYKKTISQSINPHLEESEFIINIEKKVTIAMIAGMLANLNDLINLSGGSKTFISAALVTRAIILLLGFKKIVSQACIAFIYKELKDTYDLVNDFRDPLPNGYTSEDDLIKDLLRRLETVEGGKRMKK